MEVANKKDVMTAIGRSAEELQQHIEMHRRLVASIIKGHVDEGNLEALLDVRLPSSREARLKKAIMETIEVLEESRKAFKSKRLEALRKKLTVVLIDHR